MEKVLAPLLYKSQDIANMVCREPARERLIREPAMQQLQAAASQRNVMIKTVELSFRSVMMLNKVSPKTAIRIISPWTQSKGFVDGSSLLALQEIRIGKAWVRIRIKAFPCSPPKFVLIDVLRFQ